MRTNNINSINFTSRPISLRELEEVGTAIRRNQVFLYDVDTTHGFMDKAVLKRADGIRDGLPVPHADAILSALKNITEMAKGKIPKFETVDAHSFSDPELQIFTAISDIHCQKGTLGSEKIPETIFGNPDALIEVEPGKQDVPSVSRIREILASKGIIKLEKNENSPLRWGNGTTGRVEESKKGLEFFKKLKHAGAQIALVYGVCTDYCVKDAVEALKLFGIKPIIIEDAIKELSQKMDAIPVYNDVTTITTQQLGTALNIVK